MDRNLQKRADKAVEKIYNQLKEKNISDEQKVEYIEKIITKLEKVEDRTKSDRVKELVGYFIEKFEEKIDLIQQKDDIESIFDILEE
jgi:arginyl-tRNA synthetase